jgi:hypothetical protein
MIPAPASSPPPVSNAWASRASTTTRAPPWCLPPSRWRRIHRPSRRASCGARVKGRDPRVGRAAHCVPVGAAAPQCANEAWALCRGPQVIDPEAGVGCPLWPWCHSGGGTTATTGPNGQRPWPPRWALRSAGDRLVGNGPPGSNRPVAADGTRVSQATAPSLSTSSTSPEEGALRDMSPVEEPGTAGRKRRSRRQLMRFADR